MRPLRELSRNAGPRWGFAFLGGAGHVLPSWISRPLLMAGTWVALGFMPVPRAHSRAFLGLVLGRPPRLHEIWRHFFAFVELIMLRLRVARGAPAACAVEAANDGEFEALIASGRPALFGTFHFGHSDLLGFFLSQRGRRVAMIRLHMENSSDTEMLQRQFGSAVSFIWINDPDELMFAIKATIDAGESLAMQCDRVAHSARVEPFQFLGARRLFPFTIYHLSLLFDRPVMFCVGLSDGRGGTRVVASPLFQPDPAASRAENLGRARVHFQAVLTQLETLIRQHPMLWFNFLPLNPEESKPPGTLHPPGRRQG